MFKGRNLKGIKKAIFFWAVKLGDQYKEVGNSAWYLFKLKIADKLVFSKWRAALEMRFYSSFRVGLPFRKDWQEYSGLQVFLFSRVMV
jgi:long-subunit acyl-CoA synthetase (AMP-forming)